VRGFVAVSFAEVTHVSPNTWSGMEITLMWCWHVHYDITRGKGEEWVSGGGVCDGVCVWKCVRVCLY